MVQPITTPTPLPAHVQERIVSLKIRNGMIVIGLIIAALAIGTIGYHYLNELSWLDAALNASMILTGMGPVAPLVTPQAKVFAIAYALTSSVFFMAMLGLILGPSLQSFMHRFHLELAQQAGKARTLNPEP
jgi:uncharacterized membrane protein